MPTLTRETVEPLAVDLLAALDESVALLDMIPALAVDLAELRAILDAPRHVLADYIAGDLDARPDDRVTASDVLHLVAQLGEQLDWATAA